MAWHWKFLWRWWLLTDLVRSPCFWCRIGFNSFWNLVDRFYWDGCAYIFFTPIKGSCSTGTVLQKQGCSLGLWSWWFFQSLKGHEAFTKLCNMQWTGWINLKFDLVLCHSESNFCPARIIYSKTIFEDRTHRLCDSCFQGKRVTGITSLAFRRTAIAQLN